MEAADRDRSGDRDLLSIEGREVAGLVLHLELGPAGPTGARYFELFLVEPGRSQRARPVLRGFYHRGPQPAQNWVEVLRVTPREALPPPGNLQRGAGDALTRNLSHGERELQDLSRRDRESQDASQGERERREVSQNERGRQALSQRDVEQHVASDIGEALLRLLAELVPPGGHMMVEYETRPETERSLALGVPPAATHLGRLMSGIGCGTAFKDWYFTEGWSEGPRKLQGYKALDQEHARRRARTTAMELLDFLARPYDPGQEDIFGPARRRAREVLRSIQTGDSDLDRRIREASGAG